jgi:hypothetical protein
LGYGPSTSQFPNTTHAGSNLRWANMYNSGGAGDAGWMNPSLFPAPAGSWRTFGQIGYSINNSGVYNVNNQRNVSSTLFQRYA